MPRLKQEKPDFDRIGRLFKGYGANGANLSKALVCAPNTARKKLAEPKHFTLDELNKAARHFGIPFDEVRDSIVR